MLLKNTYEVLKQLSITPAFPIVVDVHVKVVWGAILGPPAIIREHLVTVPHDGPFVLGMVFRGL
jgi:hypothetical protein